MEVDGRRCAAVCTVGNLQSTTGCARGPLSSRCPLACRLGGSLSMAQQPARVRNSQASFAARLRLDAACRSGHGISGPRTKPALLPEGAAALPPAGATWRRTVLWACKPAKAALSSAGLPPPGCLRGVQGLQAVFAQKRGAAEASAAYRVYPKHRGTNRSANKRECSAGLGKRRDGKNSARTAAKAGQERKRGRGQR